MSCYRLVHLNGGPKRSCYAAVSVEHKVYAFGVVGYGDNAHIGVHVLDTVALLCRSLPPLTPGRMEHSLTDYLLGCTAVLIGDTVYIWGVYPHCNSNVLYAFDVDTHRWSTPRVSGTVPEERREHSACVLGKLMYICGGRDRLGVPTNGLYKLDTSTMFWSLIDARGTPQPIFSAAIIETKMFVCGGCKDLFRPNVSLCQISVFDTETNSWLFTPSAPLLPNELLYSTSHSAFAYNEDLYIYRYGGPYSSGVDLWRFNPDTLSWKGVKPKGKGPCSSWICTSCRGGPIILFERRSPSNLYILDLSPSLKTLCKLAVIQKGLGQSELPHNIRWELAAMT